MRAKERKYFKNKLLQKKSELISLVQKTEDYGREANTEAEGMDLADKASSSYTKEFMFRGGTRKCRFCNCNQPSSTEV